MLSVPCPSSVSACDEIDPIDLRPGDTACADIERDGDPIAAYTYQELMAIINGGAILYAQYGFVAAVFQNYVADLTGQPVPVTLSVFNQGTAPNATDLYQDPGSGGGDPVPDWPGNGAARFRVELLSSTLQFHDECFYGSVMVLSTDESAYAAARCLAEEVVALLQGQLPVEPASWGKLKERFR